MLELLRTRSCVVACMASPPAIDACERVPGALAGRISEDEAMLVASPPSSASVLAAAVDRASAADDDALVLDVSDGWATWTLRGRAAAAAFSSLSQLAIPARGVVAGEVAGVAARVAVTDAGIHVFVPSMLEAHVRSVIVRRCARFRPTDGGTEDWAADGGTHAPRDAASDGGPAR